MSEHAIESVRDRKKFKKADKGGLEIIALITVFLLIAVIIFRVYSAEEKLKEE